MYDEISTPRRKLRSDDNIDVGYVPNYAPESESESPVEEPSKINELVNFAAKGMNQQDDAEEREMTGREPASQGQPLGGMGGELAILIGSVLGAGIGGGGMEEAAGAATQGLGRLHKEKREDKKQQDKLSAYLAKSRGTASKLQKATYIDAAGIARMGNFDPATGQVTRSASDPRVPQRLTEKQYSSRLGQRGDQYTELAKHKGFTKNEEGQIVTTDKITGKVDVVKPEDVTPRQRKDLLGLADKFESKSMVKEIQTSLRMMKNIKASLAANNPIADELAKTFIARAAEGGGKLSDADVNRLGGDKDAFWARTAQAIKQFKTGGLTKRNKKFLMEVASIVEANDRAGLKSYRDSYSKSRETGTKLSAEQISRGISVPELSEGTAQPKQTSVIDENSSTEDIKAEIERLKRGGK